MLPNGKRDKRTATQAIMYCIWTLVASIMPAFGITGKLQLSTVSAVIVGLLGLGLVYYAYKLYVDLSEKTARKLMLTSVSYITLIQLIYVIDKFVR